MNEPRLDASPGNKWRENTRLEILPKYRNLVNECAPRVPEETPLKGPVIASHSELGSCQCFESI